MRRVRFRVQRPISPWLFLLPLTLFANSIQASEPTCAPNIMALLGSAETAATHAVVSELELRVFNPTGAILRDLKNAALKGEDKSVQYIVDMNNRFFLVDQRYYINFESYKEGELPLTYITHKNGITEAVTIKDAGELRYQKSNVAKWKKVLFSIGNTGEGYTFEQKMGLDLSEDESRDMAAQLKHVLSPTEEEDISRIVGKEAGFSQADVIRCTNVFDAHTQGSKFIFNKFKTDVGMWGTYILLGDRSRLDGDLVYYGLKERDPNRDYDEDMLAADAISTPVNTLIKTTASLVLVKSSLSIGADYMWRAGISTVSIGLQTGIYHFMTDNSAKKIGAYNMGYMLIFSTPKTMVLDNWMLEGLPDLAYQACLKNSALRFIVSPTTIRIGENLGSAFIYYLGRKLFVGDAKKDEPKEAETPKKN